MNLFNQKALIALAVVVVASFGACKKDETSNADLLQGKCWKQTKSEVYNATTAKWESEPIEACSADDCTTFSSDNKTTFDEGATKCDPADPQSSTGVWALAADQKTLTITAGGFGLSGTITEISSSKFVWEYDIFGDKARETFTR
jgi:hypothetical protein